MDGLKRKGIHYFIADQKTSKGQHGTGFIITGCATQCILGFEPINGRMCKLRTKGKFYNMTIISAHAATEDENNQNDENVERFYNKLSDVCVTKHQEMMP
jgi:exonuclease III